MIPSLPQSDADPAHRAAELTRARRAYRYDHALLSPAASVAMADAVPKEEAASIAWKLMVAGNIVRLMINSAVLQGHENTGADHPVNRSHYDAVVQSASGSLGLVLEQIKSFVITGGLGGRATRMQEFDDLFLRIPVPLVLADHLSDASFGRMRVAGPNPMSIQRVLGPDPRLPVTDAELRAATSPDDSLAAAVAEGRLYLCDYSALDGLPCGCGAAGQKYVAAPLALFAVPRGSGMRYLAPVAIQLGPRPGRDAPIFTPRDGWGWTIAKSLVSTADGNAHQAVHHLAHTHLVIEAFALATRRCLSPRHPLSVLLTPHFEGTLQINRSAVDSLLAPNGGVDSVLSGQIDAARAAAARAVSAWDFGAAMPPIALARRGVDHADALPYYPYRDDALLLWSAIQAWTTGYVRLYYASNADVAADTELQAWAAELVAPDGGGIRGFGEGGGRVRTLDYLAPALALVIFTASAQHAAVNFPQFDVTAHAPSMPLAAYAPPPRAKAGLDEQAYLALLPPLDLAHYQLALGFLLGTARYTRLGGYGEGGMVERALSLTKSTLGLDVSSLLGSLGAPASAPSAPHFADPRVRDLLASFQQKLEAIERVIARRNQLRAPYDFLRPSLIPQSINV